MKKVLKKKVIDQMNREVEVPLLPQRIISLVPSQTELLFDFGLDTQIVGVTKFCIHPQYLCKKKTIVGGTKKFRFDAIDALRPDLIIGNKEENYVEGIDRLCEKYPVWMSDIDDLTSAKGMITEVGNLCNRQENARKLLLDIQHSLDRLPLFTNKKALYFIWNNPMMVAGNDTFINSMLQYAGFENIINTSRYPELTVQQSRQLKPDVVLLSSEPYPFSQKHIDSFRQLFPNAKVMIVDGELFSWYGSRLVKSANYINQLRAGLDRPA